MEPDLVTIPEAVLVNDGDIDLEMEGEKVADCVPDRVGLELIDGDMLGDHFHDVVVEHVCVCENVEDHVIVGNVVCEQVAVELRLCVGVKVLQGVTLLVSESECDEVTEAVRVETEAERVEVWVSLGVGCAVCVLVLDVVADAVMLVAVLLIDAERDADNELLRDTA